MIFFKFFLFSNLKFIYWSLLLLCKVFNIRLDWLLFLIRSSCNPLVPTQLRHFVPGPERQSAKPTDLNQLNCRAVRNDSLGLCWCCLRSFYLARVNLLNAVPSGSNLGRTTHHGFPNPPSPWNAGLYLQYHLASYSLASQLLFGFELSQKIVPMKYGILNLLGIPIMLRWY